MSLVSSEFQPLLAQKHWWFSLPVISTCVIPDMFSTQFHLGFVSGNVLSSVLTLSCTMVTVMSIIQTRKGRLREFSTSPPEDEAKADLKAGLQSNLFLSDPKAPFLLSHPDPPVGHTLSGV